MNWNKVNALKNNAGQKIGIAILKWKDQVRPER